MSLCRSLICFNIIIFEALEMEGWLVRNELAGCFVACERRHISGCHLSPLKITSVNSSQETISVW